MTDKLKKTTAAFTAAVMTFILAAYPASAATINTGDGRTYKALAVFGIAAVIIVLLIVIGKKKK